MIEEVSHERGLTVTDEDDTFSSASIGSGEVRTGYRGSSYQDPPAYSATSSQGLHTYDTQHIDNQQTGLQMMEGGVYAGDESRRSRGALKLFDNSPKLRGILVHQYPVQIDGVARDPLTMFLKIIGDLIMPTTAYQPNRMRPEDKKKSIVIARLRMEDGRQREARFEGDFMLGSINLGDEISLWGYLRKGTLVVSRAYNHTTQAKIATRSNQSRQNTLLLLVAFVALITVIVFYLGDSFIPNLMNILQGGR